MGEPFGPVLLSTETGDFWYTTTANQLYVVSGALTVNGNALTGEESNQLAEAVPDCSKYPDFCSVSSNPSFDGNPTIAVTGTVAQQASLAMTDSNGTTTWVFSNLYLQPSSLQAISGNWGGVGPDKEIANAPTPVLTISASGVIYEQDGVSQCVLNGQVTLIDPTYNAYALRFTYSNCSASGEGWTYLNGDVANGVGYIDTTVTPNVLTVAGAFGYYSVNRL